MECSVLCGLSDLVTVTFVRKRIKLSRLPHHDYFRVGDAAAASQPLPAPRPDQGLGHRARLEACLQGMTRCNDCKVLKSYK